MRFRVSAIVLAAVVMTASVGAAVESPVADAARAGDRDAVKSLMKEGADVNAPQGDGMTALHWAAERGDLELTNILIYGGANVAAVTRIGQYTPLHVAARTGNAAVVKALVAAKADVAAKASPSGVPPLHLAAASGDLDTITTLLDHKADINALENEWGQTPLMFAAAADRTAAVKLLLQRGADANVTSKFIDLAQQAALDRAARLLQTKILEATVSKGQKATASQLQASVQAARELLLSGKVPPPEARPAGPDTTDRNFNPEEINPPVAAKGGLTALHHAVRQGYVETTRALIDGGADINQQTTGDGTTPLLMAAINGQFDIATLLIEKGADPNIASKGNGVTPLWATINTQWQPRTRFPQPQNMELQKTTYLQVMEALAKGRRRRERPHPVASLVHGLHRLRQPQLRSRRQLRLDGVLACRVFGRRRCHEAARALRCGSQYSDDGSRTTDSPWWRRSSSGSARWPARRSWPGRCAGRP